MKPAPILNPQDFMSDKKKILYKPEAEGTLKGEVTDVQIELWKKEFGDRIFQMTRDDKCAYMRKPDRVIMAFLTTVPRDQFNETLINNCWLAGNEELKTDEDAYMWLCGELTKLLDWGTGEL